MGLEEDVFRLRDEDVRRRTANSAEYEEQAERHRAGVARLNELLVEAAELLAREGAGLKPIYRGCVRDLYVAARPSRLGRLFASRGWYIDSAALVLFPGGGWKSCHPVGRGACIGPHNSSQGAHGRADGWFNSVELHRDRLVVPGYDSGTWDPIDGVLARGVAAAITS